MCRPFRDTGKPLPAWLGGPLLGWAQRLAERRHARIRSDLLRVDEQLKDMLAFAGRVE
jgi:hypothetical protein